MPSPWPPGRGSFSALQETIRVISRKAELEATSLRGLKSVFAPTSLMCLIMDPFFKHYTPQLAHNCCPCPMNYALCEANPGSLALDKSQAVEEAGVITKTIPGPWGRGAFPASPPCLPPLVAGVLPHPTWLQSAVFRFKACTLCRGRC